MNVDSPYCVPGNGYIAVVMCVYGGGPVGAERVFLARAGEIILINGGIMCQ